MIFHIFLRKKVEKMNFARILNFLSLDARNSCILIKIRLDNPAEIASKRNLATSI